MTESLRPMLTLADVYGPERLYLPRAHRNACEWLPRDPGLFDSLTGNQLCVAGTMPVVCSAGSACPEGLELMAEAGLEAGVSRYTFRDDREAVDVALGLVKEKGWKLVVQHVHPTGVLPADACWIAPRLLSQLNNKRNLCTLAPAAHVPARSVALRAEFFRAQAPRFPVVLKAVTDQSSAGGAGVLICRSKEDLLAASDYFLRCDHVVVESFLRIARNPCLHYTVMPDATVLYLGFADQDVTEEGRYRGNWIHLRSPIPQEAVEAGRAVMQRGAALGYRGLAGIDMALLSDGRIVVLDLNFRVNGSSAAVLLAPQILRQRGPAVMHLRSFRGNRTFAEMIVAARAAVRRGRLLPLGTFDPQSAGHPTQSPRLNGIVLGSSQPEVLAVEAELAADGLA